MSQEVSRKTYVGCPDLVSALMARDHLETVVEGLLEELKEQKEFVQAFQQSAHHAQEISNKWRALYEETEKKLKELREECTGVQQ